MTEEELFKVYIKRELCAHCRFPQFCKGEEDCSDISTAKRHYLAGAEAGKSLAETDLAIVAYMQGAERYKTKWHNLRKNPKDLPDACMDIVNQDGEKVRYDYVNEVWRTDDANDYICDTPIAWCEIPTFNDKE